MAIFDVVINTDDLVVLGPPDVIDLAISIGEKGNRGATFYAGSGNPNLLTVSENIFGISLFPVSGDLFINVAIGDEYGWLYIYNPKIVGNQWDQILKMQPAIYSSKVSSTFSAGITTISVPISNIIVNNTGLLADNFKISLTPYLSDPVALSINSKSISGSNLNIVVEAVKYSSSVWSSVTGIMSLDLIITVV